MAYETAKRLLKQAVTFAERTAAVREVLSLGMPLHEIEEYLDEVDCSRPSPKPLTIDRSFNPLRIHTSQRRK